MSDSITIAPDPQVQYLLRLADTCLIHAQRLGEWCGHGPILEEDIALTNMAIIGAARGLYTHIGTLAGMNFDEDQLAFLRKERDYVNLTLVELPRGDYAFTVMRNALLATFLRLLWEGLLASTDSEVAGIAGKAVKEARYHQQHNSDWVIRLGDGTGESARRMNDALVELWRYVPEMFESDAVDEEAAAAGLGPRWGDLREAWDSEMLPLLAEAKQAVPAPSPYRSAGKFGRHSEHLGYILSELQFLQRTYPGGTW